MFDPAYLAEMMAAYEAEEDTAAKLKKPRHDLKCGGCHKFIARGGLYVLSKLGTMHIQCFTKVMGDDVSVLGPDGGIRRDSPRVERQEAEREVNSDELPPGTWIPGVELGFSS